MSIGMLIWDAPSLINSGIAADSYILLVRSTYELQTARAHAVGVITRTALNSYCLSGTQGAGWIRAPL